MNTKPIPRPKRYFVHELSQGAQRGRLLATVEEASCLLVAADVAALTLSRRSARPVAALLDEDRGIFIAYGKVPWIRYPKGDPVKEIRFSLSLDRAREIDWFGEGKE